jgi:hypothetical protein
MSSLTVSYTRGQKDNANLAIVPLWYHVKFIESLEITRFYFWHRACLYNFSCGPGRSPRQEAWSLSELCELNQDDKLGE